MVHLWDINSLKSYSLNTLEAFFFLVLFKFLAFVMFSVQGYDSAPLSALKSVSQSDMFKPDTDSQKDEEETVLPVDACDC